VLGAGGAAGQKTVETLGRLEKGGARRLAGEAGALEACKEARGPLPTLAVARRDRGEGEGGLGQLLLGGALMREQAVGEEAGVAQQQRAAPGAARQELKRRSKALPPAAAAGQVGVLLGVAGKDAEGTAAV
jgi:hypothetical protein